MLSTPQLIDMSNLTDFWMVFLFHEVSVSVKNSFSSSGFCRRVYKFESEQVRKKLMKNLTLIVTHEPIFVIEFVIKSLHLWYLNFSMWLMCSILSFFLLSYFEFLLTST